MIREDALCADCGYAVTRWDNTRPHPRFPDLPMPVWPWEWYMVRDELWAEAGMKDGFLCVGCLEARIGRPLNRLDFPDDLPVNWDKGTETDRLLEAKTRPPLVPAFQP